MPNLPSKKTQAIIVAAGSGTRLNASLPKPLVKLRGKPLVIYSLMVFEKSPLVSSVVIVGSLRYLPELQRLVRKYRLKKISRIVAGGETRALSVSQGLQALDDDTQFVLIHDAARPLVSLRIVEEAVKSCYKEAGVIVAVPAKPTIKRVNSRTMVIEETLDRRKLWEVQTPQVFRKDIIFKAHRIRKDVSATDDAFLVEKLGQKVKVVVGDYRNIKITTPEDLIIARALLNNSCYVATSS